MRTRILLLVVVASFVLPQTLAAEVGPNALNLKSHGRWITGYFSLPDGYQLEDVDTVFLEWTVADRVSIDEEEDIVIAKFERAEVVNRIVPNQTELTLLVFFYDGTRLEETDAIKLRHWVTDDCENGLVLDEESGLCMEEIVLDKLDVIRMYLMRVCDHCGHLPRPVISLDGGDRSSSYVVELGGANVRRFIMPFFTVPSQIVSNPENVLQVTYRMEVNGTNFLKFLIPGEGNYFQNRYDVLEPNRTTNVRYEIVKREGAYGSAYFFALENDTILDLDGTIQTFDDIAIDHSLLANLPQPDPYYVIAMPSMFALLLGGEGNFYFGNHLITMSFGGEKFYDLYRPDVFKNEMAHEYVHGMQETLGLRQSYHGAAFLMEGTADAIAIYNGYREWSGVGPFGEDIDPGCSYLSNPGVPHTLGRCIFKHLDQSGYLTNEFFDGLLHPDESYELATCDIFLGDETCVAELNALLSHASGTDMTDFMRTELLADL